MDVKSSFAIENPPLPGLLIVERAADFLNEFSQCGGQVVDVLVIVQVLAGDAEAHHIVGEAMCHKDILSVEFFKMARWVSRSSQIRAITIGARTFESFNNWSNIGTSASQTADFLSGRYTKERLCGEGRDCCP